MISKKHKAIFIHIQKTAGTSIETKLGHFESNKYQDHRKIQDLEKIVNRKYNLRKYWYHMKHLRVNRANYFLKNILSPELTKQEYETFYKFTFVRNTWSRMYSWYASIIQDDIQRGYYGLNLDSTFEEYLKSINHKKWDQLSFLKNKDDIIDLDFIGRFENLKNDFKIVCNDLEIKNSELPKVLVRGNKHYTEAYNNKLKDFIYKNYKEEINYFNFEYGE